MISTSFSPLRLALLDEASSCNIEASGRPLGTVCFSPAFRAAPDHPALPFVHVPMPLLAASGGLDGATSVREIWCSADAVQTGRRHGVSFSHDDELLFGVIQLDERDFAFPGSEDGATPLQRAGRQAYASCFRLLADLGFPAVLRFWNYIADINGESHGMERYRQFNIGRQEGFLSGGQQVEGAVVPAASALGCGDGPLTVAFLAGRSVRPIAIENPRQVSAYRYPAQYGPRSPTFSRASVVRLGDDSVLLISGTASIVGHQTLHAGDVVAQTRETLANLQIIIDQANLAAPDARFALEELACKVYVRRPEDVPVIRAELKKRLGGSARLVFLKADICRSDLLVEIEATGGHPLQFPAAA